MTDTSSDTPAGRAGARGPAGALCQLALDRGLATLTEIEAAIENQLAYGGHLGTNLVEVGGVKENNLQRLLAEHYHMPVGPRGKLPAVEPPLEAALSRELSLRHRVYPIKLSTKSLHVATDRPLDVSTVTLLGVSAPLPIRPVIVTPLRLTEALAAHVGGPLTERERWLLQALNSGTAPSPASARASAERRAQRAFPVAAAYRRMSEHPRGIVPSLRQAPHRHTEVPRAPESTTLSDASVAPDTIEALAAAEDARSVHRTLEPGDPDQGYSEPPSSTEEISASGVTEEGLSAQRITQPYGEGEEAEQERRDTQPWRDDEPDDGPPLSVAGEFKASLSDPVPSEARARDELRFRHRGPFTRAQAELAAGQAPDVHTVLEVLVRYAQQFFERTVLFVVAGEQAELRVSHGLTMSLASLRLSLREEPSVLREAFLAGDPVVKPLAELGVDAILRNKLSISGNQRVVVIPMTIRERVVTLFYGDDAVDGVDRDAVADVTDFIEICANEISRLIIRRKRGD